MNPHITSKTLKEAAELQVKVEAMQAKIAAMLNGGGGYAAPIVPSRPKRHMSPELKARFSKMMAARWAKVKKSGKNKL